MIPENFKNHWRFYATIIYFTVLILLVVGIVKKQNSLPAEAVAPPPQVIAEPKVDLEPLTKRIEQLEQALERQTKDAQVQAAKHDQQERVNQRLERRLQAHTEAFKRLCEYVMVITVDKKIVPRQCLPEYKWSREEGA
jgi:ribosomal protein S15P/S13E